jgi:signal peptidase II
MNPGLAFGVLAGVPTGWRWVVAALSLAALVVLARVALRVLPAHGWLGAVAVGMIFGGAVGNLIDRLRWGAVVDFVDVHWRSYHWLAFNVADSAITVGVALLALQLMGRQPATSPGVERGITSGNPGFLQRRSWHPARAGRLGGASPLQFSQPSAGRRPASDWIAGSPSACPPSRARGFGN